MTMKKTEKARKAVRLSKETIFPSEPTSSSYKVPLSTEIPFFISSKEEERQLKLFDRAPSPSRESNEEETVKVLGLKDLTESGYRALEALKLLLAKTDFKGNSKATISFSNVIKQSVTNPVLALTKTEYFEAYGLKRDSDGAFTGQENLQTALRGLKELTVTRQFIVNRRRIVNGQGVNDCFIYDKPLISILEGYTGISDRERELLEAGETIEKESRLLIELAWIFTFNAEDFFLLRRTNKTDMIRELAGKNVRMRFKLSRLTAYLEACSFHEHDLTVNRLAEIADMTYLIEQRKPTQLKKALDELLDFAKDGNWLTDWSFRSERKVYTLTLNPELCHRVKANETKKGDET